MYDEALAKGYVEASVTKCLIIGAAGVGKTHLKHLLLKKDPPNQRVSTGLADNPARAMSFSWVGLGEHEDDWVMVQDDEELLRIIGNTISSDSVSMASCLNDVVSNHPKIDISNVPSKQAHIGADIGHPGPIPANVNTIKDTTQQEATLADFRTKLIHFINTFSGKW